MNYLVVVAHPDDETLGSGGTIKKLTETGDTVDLCIMSGQAKARTLRPADAELNSDMCSALKELGIRNLYEGTFPNIEMNTIPHLHLVQFIENAIIKSEAEVIITHHPSDTNNDHLHTSLACQAAIRIFQRKPDIKPISELWFMEVLSSTEWSINSAMNNFNPNLYVEIGKTGIEKKINTLSIYRDVMRKYPHPRSREAIEGLAAYRGAQAGCEYAEAYQCVFRRL